MDFGEQVDILELLEQDHALFSTSQIQKDHSIDHLLSCFIMALMVGFHKPKLLKQHNSGLGQYPLALTSNPNMSTFQPLFSITLFRGVYLLTLALCQASIFSSHGQLSSMRITLFSLLEKIIVWP